MASMSMNGMLLISHTLQLLQFISETLSSCCQNHVLTQSMLANIDDRPVYLGVKHIAARFSVICTLNTCYKKLVKCELAFMIQFRIVLLIVFGATTFNTHQNTLSAFITQLHYYNYSLQVRNGHIKRITDNDIQSLVLEIVGTNVRYVSHVLYQSPRCHVPSQSCL